MPARKTPAVEKKTPKKSSPKKSSPRKISNKKNSTKSLKKPESAVDLKSLNKKTVQITQKKRDDSNDAKYVTVVSTGWTTPKLYVKKCYLFTPCFFKGSSVPRYKLICDIDSNIKDHRTYISRLEDIAKKHGVRRLGYEDGSGALCQIFQTKDRPLVYITTDDKEDPVLVDLANDLPEDTPCQITFDIRLYENKMIKEPMFNFVPTQIIFYLDPNEHEIGEI